MASEKSTPLALLGPPQCLRACLPNTWMPMKMCDRQNRCDLGLHDEERAKWKPVENGSPKLLKDERKAQRPFFDPRKRCPKFNEEFRPEALPFALVPRCRCEGIELCFRPNFEQRHLPTGAETLLYSFDDVFPRSGFFRRSLMCREPFCQEGLLPLLERYLVDIRGDVIPERLHVVDLVFDRKRLKTGIPSNDARSQVWLDFVGPTGGRSAV